MNSIENLRNDNLSIINDRNKKVMNRIEHHIINAIYMKLITELEYSLKFSDEVDNITNDIIIVNKLMTQLNKLSRIYFPTGHTALVIRHTCTIKCIMVQYC